MTVGFQAPKNDTFSPRSGRFLSTALIVVGFLLTGFTTTPARADGTPASILIIGDSSSTGAVADPRLGVHTIITRLYSALVRLDRQPPRKPMTDWQGFTDALSFVFTAPLHHGVYNPQDSFIAPTRDDYTNPNYFNILEDPPAPLSLLKRQQATDTMALNRDLQELDLPIREKRYEGSSGWKLRKDIWHWDLISSAEAYGNTLIDIPEYSWGYLLGRKMGVPAENIFLTAKNGQRIGDGMEQWSRFHKRSGLTESPDFVFIMFGVNELCNREVFSGSLEQTENRYYTAYFEHLRSLFAFMNDTAVKPKGKATRVILLKSLNIIEALLSPPVLNKKVPFAPSLLGTTKSSPGRSAACYQLRSLTNLPDFSVSKEIGGLLGGMCRSFADLNTPTPNAIEWDSETLNRKERLRRVHLAHTRAQEDAVRLFQTNRAAGGIRKAINPAIDFQILNETFELPIFEDFVANDCFHPSLKGHEAIADIIFQNL